MANSDMANLSCGEFAALPEVEQRAFVLGVADGRTMTAAFFQIYAHEAQEMAKTPKERKSISRYQETIQGMLLPLLTIDPVSLLNGLRAACKRPELKDDYVINTLASVHVDVAKTIRNAGEQSES